MSRRFGPCSGRVISGGRSIPGDAFAAGGPWAVHLHHLKGLSERHDPGVTYEHLIGTEHCMTAQH